MVGFLHLRRIKCFELSGNKRMMILRMYWSDDMLWFSNKVTSNAINKNFKRKDC